MSARNKLIIFVIGLIVIIFLFWLIAFRSGSDTTSEQELSGILIDLSQQPVSSADRPATEGGLEISEPKPLKVELRDLSDSETQLREIQNMVRTFVEIWGSVSNQDSLATLNDLDDQMTPRVRRFRDSYIDDIRVEYPYTQGYFGVTTQVVSVNFEDETTLSSHLTAQVGTRREESVNNKVREYNQDVEIQLVKISGDWLVDSVIWEDN